MPSKVDRVVTTTDTVEDKVRSRLTELFSKNISDHSTGAYRELCEGVDKTFEAVPSTLTLADASNSIVPVWKTNIGARREHYLTMYTATMS